LDQWLEMAVPLEHHQLAPATSAWSALASGDLRALTQVYEEHHGSIRAFARRLVGDEAAEDLVHDTFLTLPKAVRRWNGESSLRTFLIGIALNHARHHVRAAARRRAAMQRWAAEPSSQALSAPEQLDQRALSHLLILALDKLSFDHRTAFVLCEVEERPAAEVGALLGVPEATVRTRLFHARKKLRAILERRGLR
jgi:RNA polymerase sigma-70 factor, ECF subfamily